MSALKDAVTKILNLWETQEGRRDAKYGASVSTVVEKLREEGWRNLGNMADFESQIEQLEFKVVPAVLKSGKNHKSTRCITF